MEDLKSPKFCIAMQYYEGDRAQAQEVCELMADIEKTPRQDVVFLVMHRFDSNPLDFKVETKLKEKFGSVFIQRGNRREIGWPDGCNALWYETMLWSLGVQRSGLPGVASLKCVLTCESDCVPLCLDWIDKLKVEWDKVNRSQEKYVVGHYVDKDHYNGNAMFHPSLAMKIPDLYNVPLGRSWDVHFTSEFLKAAYDTPLIHSNHNCKTATKDLLYKGRNSSRVSPVLYHGVKDDSARKIVRKELGL